MLKNVEGETSCFSKNVDVLAAWLYFRKGVFLAGKWRHLAYAWIKYTDLKATKLDLGTVTFRKLMGGRAKYKKNIRARQNWMKKNSCTPINPKKYSCWGLKKIHTRNLITKKNSCGSFAVNNWSNLWRYWFQMFVLFLAAIFVPLGWAQIWRPHSEAYKFRLHILKNNSAAENCTDVSRDQFVYLSIFYNIWNNWLQTFHGFDFSFRYSVTVKTTHRHWSSLVGMF